MLEQNYAKNVIDDVFKRSSGQKVPGVKWLAKECGITEEIAELELKNYLSFKNKIQEDIVLDKTNENTLDKKENVREKRKYIRRDEKNFLQSVSTIKLIFGAIGLALIVRDFSYQFHFFLSIGDYIGSVIGSIVLTSLLLFTPPVIVYCKKITRFILIIFYIPVILIGSFITVQNVTSGFYEKYKIDNTKDVTEDNNSDKVTYRKERENDINIRDSYKPNSYYYRLYNEKVNDLNSKIDTLRIDNSKLLTKDKKVDWSNSIDSIFHWQKGTVIFILAIVLAIVLSLASPVSSLIWFFLKE